MITVTFVGAGSIEFTRNVVTDLCGYPEFRGGLRLALYDISPGRLAHAERLARRISAQAGAGAEVTASLDRREALAGCLKKLKQGDQRLVEACYGEESRVPEVAQSWGRSSQSIHNSLKRIRQSLSECVRRSLVQEGLA